MTKEEGAQGMSGLIERGRRDAVRNWRWNGDRTAVPTVQQMLVWWPEMKDCPHKELALRTHQNDHGAVLHVECLDCPKSAMRLVTPEELVWPGQEFWPLNGRPGWATELNLT